MQGRCGEWSITYHLQAVTTGIQLLPPTDIGLGSCFLRTDIGIELFIHTLAINTQVCAVVAVTVVFYRTTTIIFYGFKTLRHLHLHTEAEHRRYCGILVGCHLLGHFDGSFVVDDISQI